jgi:hypothetical protein
MNEEGPIINQPKFREFFGHQVATALTTMPPSP